MYTPTKGAIWIDDVALRDVRLDSWHRYVSVLQQDFLQYSFTDVEGNIFYGDVSRPFDKQRYHEAVKDAEADKFIAQLPQKDKTIPDNWMEDDDGNSGVKISGGQWQRLALARNFYRNSPVIVLDEPTSAIDALAEARIFGRLFNKSNQRTTITISHRMTTVEKADKIFVMEEGRIAESGTHLELVNKRGVYYRLFESQLKDRV